MSSLLQTSWFKRVSACALACVYECGHVRLRAYESVSCLADIFPHFVCHRVSFLHSVSLSVYVMLIFLSVRFHFFLALSFFLLLTVDVNADGSD